MFRKAYVVKIEKFKDTYLYEIHLSDGRVYIGNNDWYWRDTKTAKHASKSEEKRCVEIWTFFVKLGYPFTEEDKIKF